MAVATWDSPLVLTIMSHDARDRGDALRGVDEMVDPVIDLNKHGTRPLQCSDVRGWPEADWRLLGTMTGKADDHV